MRALGLIALVLLAGGALAGSATRVEEHPYAAPGYFSSCAPAMFADSWPSLNNICFQLQPGETSYTLTIVDAQGIPIGARITELTTYTAGASTARADMCGTTTRDVEWSTNTQRIQINADLGTPGACADAIAGVLRLEARTG